MSAEDDMFEGYRDGFNDRREQLPASLANRSHSYRHGWLNGRDDRLGKPRASAAALRQDAQEAIERDASR